MTTKELFDGLANALFPIITQDEDIIEVIQKNDISKEDANSIIMWLINATIGVMLNGSTGEVEKKLVKNCAHDMSVWEHKLKDAGFGEDVGETLGTILQDNINEWLEIVTKQFKKAKQQMPEDDDENVGGEETEKANPVTATFKLYNAFLGQVVAREEDVDDFLAKYSEIDKDVLLFYLTGNVFYAYLMEVKQGHIQPPKQSALMTHFDGILELLTAYLHNIHDEHIDGKVEDHDQFQKDIQEIVNDHFHEFIKKMFKKIFAAIDEAKK